MLPEKWLVPNIRNSDSSQVDDVIVVTKSDLLLVVIALWEPPIGSWLSAANIDLFTGRGQ